MSKLPAIKGNIVLLAACFLLASCGLQPLYSGGTNGVVASSLGHVEVEPIAGKAGWLMRNALNDQLSTIEGSEVKYRLVVELDDKIAGPCAPVINWCACPMMPWCWTRPPVPMPVLTWCHRNMRPSWQRKPRWKTCPSVSLTRLSNVYPCLPANRLLTAETSCGMKRKLSKVQP